MANSKPLIFTLLYFALFFQVGFFGQSILPQPYPPVSSTYELRIVNRQFVSHVVFEQVETEHYLTFILTNGPVYQAWHSTSYPAQFRCSSAKQCLTEAKKINQHLKSGWNLGLRLNGSIIEEVIFLLPPR